MKRIVLILTSILALNFLMSFLINNFLDQSNELILGVKLIQKIILIVIAYAVIRKFGLLKNIQNKNRLAGFIGILILAYSIYSVHNSTLEVSWGHKSLFFIFCILVSIFEELLFRIFVYFNFSRILKKKKIFIIVILSSLIFGLAHLTNIFSMDIVNITIINQIVFAFGIGMILQTLYIKFKNIILLYALHASINVLGSYKSRLDLNERIEETLQFRDFLFSFLGLIFIVFIILCPIIYLLLKNHKREVTIEVEV